ncbi:MAG: M50 family metallopeptidase [Christensenellales bacterium]
MLTTLSTIGSVIAAVLLLSVLITIHEFGHFIMARIFKIPVFEFSIGMGPCLFHTKKTKTRFSVRALPLGGYCAFDDDASIASGDLNLYRYPIWKRCLVVLAGPLMNILTALIVAFICIGIIGVPTVIPEVSSVSAGSPAEAAGLRADDCFISVNGVDIQGNRDILAAVLTENAGNKASIIVDRKMELVELKLVPRYNEEYGQYQIGVYLKTRYVPLPLWESIKQSFSWVCSMIVLLLSFLGNLIFKGQGASDVSGVVGTVAILSDTVKQGMWYDILSLSAFISINLGILNLIPFPALDGSKLLLYGVEAVTKKRLSIKLETIVQIIGLAVFAVLFIALTFKDVLQLIGG